MINSRDINDLCNPVLKRATEFLTQCKIQNIDVLITSTYRDYESQNALYAQGRTTPGKVVTRAKGGESYHNFRCAFDIVPIVNGKPSWDNADPIWDKLGNIGSLVGLEWAGNWVKFKEYPHFQYTGGLSLAQLRSGMQVK